jgi:RNA recognition motif-containing protein
MLPCPGILSEVRPESPYCTRLGPLLPSVPPVQDNVIIKGELNMGSKLYVGGLPYSATEQQLSETFGAHGTVASVKIIQDKFTGQSRGFGFVEMSSDAEATAAITALNGTDMGGRTLTVNEAKPMEQRSGGGGGGGFGGRGGGGKRDRW